MAATAIVVQQAPQVLSVPQVTKWSSGLFHCCQDVKACCFAFFCCPCFACSTSREFGQSLCLPMVDIIGAGILAANGMPICVPPVTLSMRVGLRYKYQIEGDICTDIVISCCCVYCSWCQMRREIEHRQKTSAVMCSQPASVITTVSQPPTVAVTMM
ncbi:cornifelin homolog [Hoplias malabaricus]|uniref:cornifelin homolog n=1 Tax=Hoplias malabaricus TaxID=27720 RepID=UPI00346295CD